MKLNELKRNDKAILINIHCEEPLKTHLYHLGCTPKTKITYCHATPCKQMILIRIRGFLLAIRKEDAQNIEVKRR